MSLTALALTLALGWTSEGAGTATRLPPAPLSLYSVAWHRALVPPDEGAMLEEGGVAVDARTGLAVCGTRDGWLHAFRPDGTRAWELKVGGAFPGAPTVSDGVVYAETPFLQAVHEGPWDFTRFTESGHRWLFRAFERLDSGVVAWGAWLAFGAYLEASAATSLADAAKRSLSYRRGRRPEALAVRLTETPTESNRRRRRSPQTRCSRHRT